MSAAPPPPTLGFRAGVPTEACIRRSQTGRSAIARSAGSAEVPSTRVMRRPSPAKILFTSRSWITAGSRACLRPTGAAIRAVRCPTTAFGFTAPMASRPAIISSNGDIAYNWPWLGAFVGFRYSTDRGRTWVEPPYTPGRPIFGETGGLSGDPVKIGTPKFVDFGRNMEFSPDGKAYLKLRMGPPTGRTAASAFAVGSRAMTSSSFGCRRPSPTSTIPRPL